MDKTTTVAIAYDFDGTLAKGNIQENSFIPELGIKKEKFWQEVKEITKNDEMDEILAYMYLLIKKAKEKNISCHKDNIKKHGESVQYFEGVEQYFDRINKYAENKNIKLEHYIISSGTKEMIKGTSIAEEFECIFASSFKYDQHNVVEWPAQAINYTTKTQYLFRINKGVKNSWDNETINEYTKLSDRSIPFEKIIYLGDGATDVPAMKMLNYQGGTSIGVYSDTEDSKKEAKKLLQNQRASYIAKADYSEDSEIDKIIKSILKQISAKEKIKCYTEEKNIF